MSNLEHEGIAIIGLAGRFPGAETAEELWANLVAGKETVSFFRDAELAASGLDPAALRGRGQYVAARGVLRDADCFDAEFFGIPPKEAEVIDPQQRVFLEVCWAAMERAGYAPAKVQGSVGVFAGATYNTYQQAVLRQHPELVELVGHELVMFGNERDYLATRVAYKLGLKGPAFSVATACSTSLVAISQACQALLTYQCDMALAGGVSVTVPQERGYYHDDGGIGSSDGHTRTFDVQASGTVFSNGVGVAVLKRLDEAVRDGDRIYAVIKGAALNNDGSQRVSFGAPGVEGQAEVVAMAHALAGVDPGTITMVEAHGTATPLGDPIEVAALTKAFRLGTPAKQFCALGSVKTNIGHLDAAAGVAGLIKTALALYHKTIPPSLHFTQPNPKLELESSPFYVNSRLQEWKTAPAIPRRAGVSSFGSGGTNAHVVLEEAPELTPSGPTRPWQLLPLSAKTPEALDKMTAALSTHLTRLAKEPGSRAAEDLADVAFTLQTGRSEFVHRRIVVCDSAADGAAALASGDPKRTFTHQQELRDPPVVFMFPGQGAQYPGMGAQLYRGEPVFRAEVDRCAEILQPYLRTDLRTLLFPSEGSEKEAEEQLVQTRFTQPALFVIEYAMARLWMSWGVRPAAMIGHSVGEYVAACLSGVFSLEDALWLIARRAELVQAQPGGAMLSVRLPESEIQPLLNGALGLAAANSPNLCVVAGPHDAIAKLEKELARRDVAARHLHTSHAFHSYMLDPVLVPFTDALRQVKLNPPQIPFVSNVTARWITAEEAQSPEYWAGHVRQTVRFGDGVAELMNDSRRVFLEVGPGQTLTTLARQHPVRFSGQTVLASLPFAGSEELRGTLEALGRLWMTGLDIDWQAFYVHESRNRTALPTYPFERKRYWPDAVPKGINAAPPVTAVTGPAAPHAASVPEVSARETTSGIAHAMASAVSRKERLLTAVRSLFQDLSGTDLSMVDPSTDLLELGLDSLLLTQAATLLRRKFGVTISFRQLMEEFTSLDALAVHLDAVLPPEAYSEPVAIVSQSDVARSVPVVPSNATLEQLLHQQQQVTNQLLELLGRQPAGPPAATRAAQVPLATSSTPKSHGPFKPIDRSAGIALTPEQRRFLEELIARYTSQTSGSKALAAKNRNILADPRSVAGFKPLWKEMVYPIYTNRSDGSKVYDVDGNEYVDFVMGFGASMFGHRPRFVVRALQEQLDLGFEIGPIQPLAGEVAALVTEFTGMARVAFTNTGSEAVLAATRVARTVTGRDKIAVFAGAYHGIFDEVLVRPLVANGETRTAPIAPGIPESALREVIVLDYGNPDSLEILRARGGEIAAVLVEPVQSRRLDLQPREFLHQLRTLTREIGSVLIFDEVVTGFRVGPGGAQAHFGVRADIATYGKVMGGGISIGVVAGDPKYIDALDGGQWQYGDASSPEVGVTFLAGTFVRHPLALAAAKAVLLHLKENGPELQERLTERTERLANQMRALLNEFEAPYQLTQFSSLIQLDYSAEQKFAGLLFYLLRERGIHIWENRAFVITTAHDDEDLSRLTQALRESLTEMRLAGFFGQPVSTTINSSRHAGTFPLTEAQKEIWLAAQMSGEAAIAYNESLKLEFRGPFNPEVFRTALRRVVERHPILFATFSPDGQTQTVVSSVALAVPEIDLSGKEENEREQAVSRLIDGEISTPFDLAVGPLLRVKIIRLSNEHFVVTWTAHHIVCDGWSTGLLINELARVYSGLSSGTDVPLEEPVPFKEYAAENGANSPEALEAIEYWRRQFRELPPPLDLPADRPRPHVRSARAATVEKTFDVSLHQALKKTAVQQRTTLVVLLLTGLKTFLHRLSGETDLVMGLGVAGQAFKGNNCLVGHCVNLLPIRTRMQQAASFRDCLMAVRQNVLDAYDHHQSTIGELLQHLRVPRSTSRPALVEVIFNLDRDPGLAGFRGLQFSCQKNAKQALHYDLFFNFVERPEGLRLECDYNAELYDGKTIERWLGHYETLLGAIVTEPASAVEDLPLLNEAECKQITVEWNHTERKYEQSQLCVHQLFEEQAAKTPNAVAVRFRGEEVSYAELNHRANQLAASLGRLGVTAESLVAVCAERSVEMIVALLGIMKAGGAYVPLDPEHPTERLAFLIKDLGYPIVLTQAKFTARLPEGQKVLLLDRDWRNLSSESGDNPSLLTGPRNAAYVIYTSGSTGTPKGVVNIHEGIVNRLLWMQNICGIGPGDRVLQKTPYSFDVSVWEIFWPLITGACLVMAEPAAHRDPSYLVKTIDQEQVTILHFVPSMLDAFVEAPGLERLSSVRHVFCSGEALSHRTQVRLWERMPHVELHNLYGPTEASVEVTYWKCAKDSPYPFVPIGKPIANTQIYVLDHALNPVPIGVPGELHIGGIGVARGYLNREELTAERFVQDPFSEDKCARLYKTGDLVRQLPDGNIEYLGRMDNQVKIRGFRIELGEIEAALGLHQAVGLCAVIVREDIPGEKVIVAYFESKSNRIPDASDLRAYLQKTLPDYMIPSQYIFLDVLPLTPSGKVDRRALPRPAGILHSTEDEFVAPRTDLERQIAACWIDVLGVERVGVHDNFFALGGHSLKVVQLLSRLDKVLQVNLPFRHVFENPTVAGMATAVLESLVEGIGESELLGILNTIQKSA